MIFTVVECVKDLHYRTIVLFVYSLFVRSVVCLLQEQSLYFLRSIEFRKADFASFVSFAKD